MKITVLDSSTLGSDLKFDKITRLGETEIYEKTSHECVRERVRSSDVVILNKVKVFEDNLADAERLKLICVTATGYDNVDTEYCKKHGIAVCNVVGYSSSSVAQLTVAMALSLVCHLSEYDKYSKSGAYTKSGIHNMLEPVFCELAGKTWGIIGMGNIGKAVAATAEVLGCHVIYTRNTADSCSVPLDTVLRDSNIISIHTPLTEKTRGMIGKSELLKCEKNPILINVSRGAVCDEQALADGIRNGTLSGLGVDVYTEEPFPENHPFAKLCDCDNVILTPHMAWGAYEARVRCMSEVAENIKSFFNGGNRGRIV